MNQSRFSHRGALIFLLSLALAVPGALLAQNNGGGNNNNANRFSPKPVLIYTVSALAGDSNAGQDLTVLIVYNNGMAFWTTNGEDNTSGSGGTGGSNGSNVQTVSLSQQQLGTLMRDIRRSGALRNGGSPRRDSQNGTRLTTVTVLTDVGDGQHSFANTFSFYGDDAGGANARIQSLIQGFLNDSFSGGDDGSGGGDGGSGS
jgi:hypothetical protein